jgi:predicted nuclease of predicted toxin-antitoxin system
VRWLLDEMLPRALAQRLSELGHDAVSVHDAELTGATDDEAFELAVLQDRLVMTENFADFVRLLEGRQSGDAPCVPVVFVRKSNFAKGGGLAARLAKHLDAWAREHPNPYVGAHWP